MIDIRPALRTDIPLLQKISIQTQLDTFGPDNEPENMDAYFAKAYSNEQFEKEFNEVDSLYCIAWEGAEAAGFYRVRVTEEAAEHLGNNALELQRLYVTKEFLGKKIGFLMMQHAMEYARAKKFEWLWLGVWEKNIKAQEFYKKIGFEKFSDHTFWMGPDPQNDWLMKVKL